ncbi:MAG: hypothetical protein IJA69_04715 [Clostridia bacterium]|nr:hypothetical protein [Clostridia bacterium]
MKFKKLLAGALVAVCAFMLVGCGQMTAKQSLESAVESCTSIETSCNTMQNGDTSASGYSNPFGLSDATTAKLEEQGEQVYEATTEFAQVFVQFGGEAATLLVKAPKLLADETAMGLITEQEVATLSDAANKLKNVESWLKAKAQDIVSKDNQTDKIMQDLYAAVIGGDVEGLANQYYNITAQMLNIMKEAKTKLSEVVTAVQNINTVVNKYVVA